MTPYLMGDATFDYRYSDHAAARLLLCLLNTRRNFVGLAVTAADTAFTVSDDYHCSETEAATALYHCRTSFDFDDAVEQAVAETLGLVGPLFA